MIINGLELPNEIQMQVLGHLHEKTRNGVSRVCQLWKFLGGCEPDHQREYKNNIKVFESPFSPHYFCIENNTNETIKIEFHSDMVPMIVLPNTSLFGRLNKWNKDAQKIVMFGDKNSNFNSSGVTLNHDLNLKEKSSLKITYQPGDPNSTIYDITKEEAHKRILNSTIFSFLFRNSFSTKNAIVLTCRRSESEVRENLFKSNGDGSYTTYHMKKQSDGSYTAVEGEKRENLALLIRGYIPLPPRE